MHVSWKYCPLVKTCARKDSVVFFWGSGWGGGVGGLVGQGVRCNMPDALDATLQPVSFCFYVQVSPWAENVFRSVMSKWNLRVKRVNGDTRRMARSALTRNGQP